MSTNYPLDSPKKKLNDFSCHKISFRKGKIQMFKHLNDFFVRCSFPVLFGYTTIEDVSKEDQAFHSDKSEQNSFLDIFIHHQTLLKFNNPIKNTRSHLCCICFKRQQRKFSKNNGLLLIV